MSAIKSKFRVLVIGDAFVDVFCKLNVGASFPSKNSDTLLTKPPRLLPGGSAINTAIHLQSLFLTSSSLSIDEIQSNSNHFTSATASSQKQANGSDTHSRVDCVCSMDVKDDMGSLLFDMVSNKRKVNLVVVDGKDKHGNEDMNSTGVCVVISDSADRGFMVRLHSFSFFVSILTKLPLLLNPSHDNCDRHIQG